MAWEDFRAFLAEIERRGYVKVVTGADCHLEIGTLTELMCEARGPMLLFDQINGYSRGYRIAGKPYSTATRSAIALGLPDDISRFDMLRLWRDKMRAYEPIAPERVSTGPVMENVQEDGQVDLTKFPTPVWHEKDGGPYFGTGCAIVTRDPDEDWVNCGTYRCMLHDPRTLGVDIAPYHHGNLHMRRWWARGESCPVAVVVSPDPYLYWASTNALPWQMGEYGYAGFLKGEPIEVLEGPRTGLPLPARAELIVEGVSPPPSEDQRLEGPFGEFTGYYAGGEKLAPVIQVQAVYYRTDPILHGDPPLKPPVEAWGFSWLNAVRVWDGLERAGIPGIKAVDTPLTEGGLTLVVSIKQQYAGHAQQVGSIASGLAHTFCRLVIVVDEDIDPANTDEVLWAVTTRSDPDEWEIQRRRPASSLDPIIPPERKRQQRGLTSNRALIVACRPWDWKDQFPEVNRASEGLRRQTYEKWRSLFP